jgi:ketosteroid isomerase-like protein
VLTVLVVLILAAAACGGDDTTASSTESSANEVRATERARLRALLNDDLDTARKLHADDFELIDPTGESLSKEAYIDSGTAFAYTSFKPISPIRVRVHGDAAVVRYESEIELSGSRGHYWHTDLYEKRDGQWQIVWSQATAAP